MNGFSDLELAFATVEELGHLLASGDVTARELAEVFLIRLERLGPALNAVAATLPDRAIREASAADRRRRRRSGSEPLAGIPYGAKDLLAARGAPTTYGSAAFAHQVFTFDAAAIARLRRAGAVLVAKLAMMELAGFEGTSPAASLFGPGISPWNPRYWAGGSSNGSAASVAAGLVPFALASETGGSIGTPSACCGVTGVRPTYGLVSRFGAMPVAWTLDKIGVIARCVDDCALVLETISGRDRRDPGSSGRRFRCSDAPHWRRTKGRVQIGYAPSDFQEAASSSDRPALAEGLAALSAIGADLVEAELPAELPYWETISTIIGAEGGTVFGGLIDSSDLDLVTDPRARASMVATGDICARDYLQAMRLRRLIQGAFGEIFERVDMLVTYTLATTEILVDAPFNDLPRAGGNTAMIAASNLAGLPALFLPCGLGSHGLPVGIQLVGPPFSEPVLLAVGMAFQAATDWHRLRPPAFATALPAA